MRCVFLHRNAEFRSSLQKGRLPLYPILRNNARSRGERMDKYDLFAKDAMEQMGAEALEELLREAPPTEDEEELRIRNACWAVLGKNV
jgi:hypothetical protein